MAAQEEDLDVPVGYTVGTALIKAAMKTLSTDRSLRVLAEVCTDQPGAAVSFPIEGGLTVELRVR